MNPIDGYGHHFRLDIGFVTYTYHIEVFSDISARRDALSERDID